MNFPLPVWKGQMIISKCEKSRDDSVWSHQQFHDPKSRAQTVDQAAKDRWDDDGGPPAVLERTSTIAERSPVQCAGKSAIP